MTNFGVKALVILGTICLVPLIGWGSPAAAQSANTDGKKCQVTGGPNKGKTGVFTEGGTWCEGKWGGTECGSTKCKALAKAVIDQGDVVVFDGNKGGLVSSFGYFATPDHGLVGCTVATPRTANCRPPRFASRSRWSNSVISKLRITRKIGATRRR
jgi:hypothetical protein